MFYAIINYQFKTSELKNVEKSVKQRNVHFCKICEIIFRVGGPWKVLEKLLQFFV